MSEIKGYRYYRTGTNGLNKNLFIEFYEHTRKNVQGQDIKHEALTWFDNIGLMSVPTKAVAGIIIAGSESITGFRSTTWRTMIMTYWRTWMQTTWSAHIMWETYWRIEMRTFMNYDSMYVCCMC